MFETYKKEILAYSEQYFQKIKTSDSPWADDVNLKLHTLFIRGKFIRGSLLIFTHDAFGGKNHNDAVIAATALELFETSILIHDDIIDRDPVRRGMPSIHTQYGSAHYGTSMAICAADVGLFKVFDLLTGISDTTLQSKLISIFSKLFIQCVYGEMEDVYFAQTNTVPTVDEVLRCYKNKTASYSFQLPLVAGALFAETHNDDLMKLGEYFGLIFQLKDDELGVFGDETVTGKPVGNDIREGKKTLYYVSSKPEIRKLFGQQNISSESLKTITDYLISSGIKKKIEEQILSYASEVQKIIASLKISDDNKNIVFSFLEYIQKRNK